MLFLCRLIATALIFVAASAKGADSPEDSPWNYDMDPMAGFKAVVKDAEMIARINTDLVLRAIVCRVPFTDISVNALLKATKLPGPRVMRGVRELKNLGLVRVEGTDEKTIKPASQEARKKMKKVGVRMVFERRQMRCRLVSCGLTFN